MKGFPRASDSLTCVIDQDVKPLLPLEEVLAESPHRAQVGEIQLHVEDVEAAAHHHLRKQCEEFRGIEW